jgi:hypothetical protein
MLPSALMQIEATYRLGAEATYASEMAVVKHDPVLPTGRPGPDLHARPLPKEKMRSTLYLPDNPPRV